jgi:TPR repeat protein
MMRRFLPVLGAIALVGIGSTGVIAGPTEEAQAALNRNDFKKALPLLFPLARSGSVMAQYNLGVMCAAGLGLERDDQEAVKWYLKAVAQGYAPAETNLGLLYQAGRGVPKDDKKAFELYLRAANQGFVPAQNNLAAMYLKGEGVEKDYAKAAEWYKKPAEQGMPLALNSLGWMYYQGWGVPRDPTKGLEMIMKAAETGLKIAQTNAMQIMVAEARSGNVRAMHNVATMCLRGWGGEHKPEECVQWYEQAAQHGMDASRNTLAEVYDTGNFGIPVDKEKAQYWRAQIGKKGELGGSEQPD